MQGKAILSPRFFCFTCSGARPLVARAEALCWGNRYPTTLHAINSCVLKLAKVTPACKVYRGLKGAALPEEAAAFPKALKEQIDAIPWVRSARAAAAARLESHTATHLLQPSSREPEPHTRNAKRHV